MGSWRRRSARKPIASAGWRRDRNRGSLLHRGTSPLVVAVVFFVAVVPTGLIMRACGKDPLRRRRAPGAPTYWISRVPPGPAPESMTQQF